MTAELTGITDFTSLKKLDCTHNQLTFSDSGRYHCTITNSLVTCLTLQSEYFTLKVSAPVNAPFIVSDNELMIYANSSENILRSTCGNLRIFYGVPELLDVAGKKCLENLFRPEMKKKVGYQQSHQSHEWIVLFEITD